MLEERFIALEMVIEKKKKSSINQNPNVYEQISSFSLKK